MTVLFTFVEMLKLRKLFRAYQHNSKESIFNMLLLVLKHLKIENTAYI